MTSAERQKLIADLVRRLLEEEAAPRRRNVLPFPKRPEPRTRELRELLEQADKT
jgi:hypothetical protein